jgi:microcystin-dependent protein
MAKTELGQNLSSVSANSVYLLKTEDDIIVGIVSLENGVDLNKHVSNLQEHLHEIRDVVGIIGESDPNAKIYANTNFISDGDSRKVTIEKLDAQLKITDDVLNAFIATKGQPNGLAELDATGRIPSSQLTLEAFEYKGTWDAALNTPTLIDGTGNTGDTYHVTSEATVDLGSGNLIFKVGFKVVYNGTIWEVWETLNEVKTVNSVAPDGAGNVSIDCGDVPEGSNLYYTEGRVSANTDVAANTSHRNTVTGNPHAVTKTEVGLGNVPNVDATQRANHTGTQTASTISDFDTEVANNTAVSANTSKVSADGSIDTHSDVDTTTTAPTSGEVLKYDGSNFIPAEDEKGFNDIDTKANLLALPREAGKLYYATDEGLAYVDDGVNLNPVGSGGGKVLKDFIVPAALATTVTFPNEAYTYGSGQNLFYRNGSLMTRELGSGDAFSVDPDLAAFEYKEVDNGDASNQILINPNAAASVDTEFSMVTHVKLAGVAGSLTAKGDLLTFDTEDVILPVGNNGQVLTADPVAPKGIKWSDLVSLPILLKGSLVTSNGVNNGELAVGADGTTLKADSSEPSGLKWEAAGGGGAETGSIITYTSDVAPTNYLLCDGAAISRTTYAALYAIVGDAYGNGDGATTFNLPDLRGRFLRGKDGAAGNDPDAAGRTALNGGNSGDALGSYQVDENKSHSHNVRIHTSNTANTNLNTANSFSQRTSGNDPYGNTQAAQVGRNLNYDSGGSESRPKNINVNYMIKY